MVAGPVSLKMKNETMKQVSAVCPVTGDTIRARYGFDVDFAARHNQRPYLSVTYDRLAMRNGRYEDVGGGVLSAEDAARVFPGHPINGLVPFHLCSADGEPMHYVANTIPEELKQALLARLPALRAQMRAACAAAGIKVPD